MMNVTPFGSTTESSSVFVKSVVDKRESYPDIPIKVLGKIGENDTSPDQIQKAVDEIEKFTQALARNLTFSIDEDTGKTIVKLMDIQTKEVIRQIPTEEVVSIARALGKIQGSLFDDKA